LVWYRVVISTGAFALFANAQWRDPQFCPDYLYTCRKIARIDFVSTKEASPELASSISTPSHWNLHAQPRVQYTGPDAFAQTPLCLKLFASTAAFTAANIPLTRTGVLR
jgi:hypothetical protein